MRHRPCSGDLPLGEGKPIAVIGHTVKGKGVSFMEGDFTWHSRVPTDHGALGRVRRAGGGRHLMSPLPMGKSLREAFGEALPDLGERDPRLVVLDGDLGSSTRADIFEAAHPERFFQMGIAEQNLVGAAAGMATLGLSRT